MFYACLVCSCMNCKDRNSNQLNNFNIIKFNCLTNQGILNTKIVIMINGNTLIFSNNELKKEVI